MSSSVLKPTSKADMAAAFPEKVPIIQGEPTMQELIQVLFHLVKCEQSHVTEGNNALNLLHKALPTNLYRHYLSDPENQVYPPALAAPGNAPVYTPRAGVTVWNNKKLQWERQYMKYYD